MATSDVKVWNGTAWVSLKGEPGPQAVSADAGNLTKLGTDAKVYTSVKASDVQGLGTISLKAEEDYLPVTGGTVNNYLNLSATDPLSIGPKLQVLGPQSSVSLSANQAGASTISLAGPGGSGTVSLNPLGGLFLGVTGQTSAFSIAATTGLANFGSGFPTARDTANNRTLTLGPKASVDAGNLTKIGTDGYLYTSVSASDVTGLGTLATKSTLAASDITGLGPYATQPTISTTDVNGLGTIALKNTGDYLPITGGNVTGLVEIGSTTGRHIDLTPSSSNITVHGFDTVAKIQLLSPTATGGALNLFSNKAGAATVQYVGGPAGNVRTWLSAVDATNGGFILARENTAGNAITIALGPERITNFWETDLRGGIFDGLGFTNTSNAANRLDYYEEGNWTPAYAGDTPITATYANASGQYTRIGRMVHCTGYLQTSAVTFRSTGNLRITGFPFPRQLGSGATGAVGIANAWVGEVPSGLTNDPMLTNAALLYDVKHSLEGKPGQPIVDVSSLTANSLLQFSFTYFTNT